MATTPSQRTLKHFRDNGWLIGRVERWVGPMGKFGKRVDLFGFIDFIALDPRTGDTLGIQSCGQSVSEHDKKIREECRAMAALWLHCGNEIVLIGWRQLLKKRGGKAKHWVPRVQRYILSDFIPDYALGDR